MFNRRRKYSLTDDIFQLSQRLRDIEGVRDMVGHEKWVDTRAALYRIVAGYDNSIIELADDPVKHREAITSKKALRVGMMGLISAIEATLSSELEVKRKLNERVKIARQAGLDIVETA